MIRRREVLAIGLNRLLRSVGFAEAVSYLILLGVAMPLKYLGGFAWAVRVAGSVHGFLFVAYVLAVAVTGRAQRWPARIWAEALMASVLPFGPFWLDRQLRRREADPSDPTQTVSRLSD